MPPQTAASGVAPSRPVTRSSIRHSLNLSSMGKALVDAMHKEVKDGSGDKLEKAAKKTMIASRRTSSVSQVPTRSATVDKLASKKGDEPSPEKTKALTRHIRKVSTVKKPAAVDSDDPSSSPSPDTPKTAVSRTMTLRSRTTGSSALPKYRPKTMLAENTVVKNPSPSRSSVRPRVADIFGGGDKKAEKAEKAEESRDSTPDSQSTKGGKFGRSVSPVPHPGALKVNLTNAINVHSQQNPEKEKEKKSRLILHKRTPSATPPSRPESVTRSLRPTKTSSKMSTSSSKTSFISSSKTSSISSATQSEVSRPPSSTSSASSCTPRKQRPSIFGSALRKAATTSAAQSGTIRKTARPATPSTDSRSSSPPRRAPTPPESPLSARSAAKAELPSSPRSIATERPRDSTTPTPTAGEFSEGISNDSIDANDVEFMLSTIVSPSEPTPALPRIRLDDRSQAEPHTPSHSNPPSRLNMSYLSPSSDVTSPFLLPLRRLPGAPERGSILSWEHLAEHSRTLGGVDVDHMIADMAAPFRPGAISPTASSSGIEMPDSPNMSTLPSPTSYGSISQVLLPDVTPSPVVRTASSHFDEAASDISLEDAGGMMMLRLQLESAEAKARDRLAEIELLESQLQTARAARAQDTEELAKRIATLEEQLQGTLRADSERVSFVASLEEQLSQAHAVREQAVQEALVQAQRRAQAAHKASLRAQRERWEAAGCGRRAAEAWGVVRDTAEGELELVRANMEMLAVLLAGLDHGQQQLTCAAA